MTAPNTHVTRSRRYLFPTVALLAGAMLLAGCTVSSTPSGTTPSAPATSSAGSGSVSGGTASSATVAQASPVTAQASPASAAQVSQPAAVAQSSPVAAAASPAAATRKVDANTASVAELQAAFEANGITQAARWAREVEEYRPYPTNDQTFGKLRQNLAKYNPAPDVLEKIVASLSLS
jgi:competence protein ComEA